LRWKQGQYRNCCILDFKTQVSRPSVWETRHAKAAIAAGKVHHLVVRKLALARHDFGLRSLTRWTNEAASLLGQWRRAATK
jgi:hypothetical protein